MDTERTEARTEREVDLPVERARLVRLCAHLTGDVHAAEDLAQETLLEAWRNAHKLHDKGGYSRWLSAIARNVCKRWNYSKGRKMSRLVTPEKEDDISYTDDGYDLDIELERHELVELLDRAMAMLPPRAARCSSSATSGSRRTRRPPHAWV